MNKRVFILCVAAGVGCCFGSCAMGGPEYYLSFLESGLLKTGCENCPTGCFSKTKQEKARDTIVDWLRKHDTPEADKSMPYGGWLSALILAHNHDVMKSAIWKLMPPETNDLEVRKEMKKLSDAGDAISRKRRSDW